MMPEWVRLMTLLDDAIEQVRALRALTEGDERQGRVWPDQARYARLIGTLTEACEVVRASEAGA